MASSISIKNEVLKLFKEDEEFRYAVAGLLGLEEILRRLDKHDSKFTEILERLERHDAKFTEILKRIERHDEMFERHAKELAKLREDMKRGFELIERRISALGGG